MKRPVAALPCSLDTCYSRPRVLDKEGYVTLSNRTLYRVSEIDVLSEAEAKGIKLTGDDLDHIRKGIESGLGFGLDIVITAAIEEAIALRDKS